MRVPRQTILGVLSAEVVRGMVIKNAVPQLFDTGEAGLYPPLRVSGGYLKAGSLGRKITITNGQWTCNDSASV